MVFSICTGIGFLVPKGLVGEQKTEAPISPRQANLAQRNRNRSLRERIEFLKQETVNFFWKALTSSRSGTSSHRAVTSACVCLIITVA